MKNPFTPNARGLVVVTLTQNYATNVAGETAGFLPEVAKELVRKGAATLPGQEAPKATQAEAEDVEITSRKFKPATVPKDMSAHDALRAEYKEVTGEDADARWGAARIAAEIDKAKDAKAQADAGA